MTLQRFDSSRDYYRELEVGKSASKQDVDRAYRRRARKLHPDGGGSDEEMKLLNEARAVLCDPETRKAYDAERGLNSSGILPAREFDPDAAARAGTLKIPVADGEFVGLLMGAAACFVVGIPLLLLIEMQWVFFLWPLRILSLGALVLGVLLVHAALAAKRRKLKRQQPSYPRRVILFQEFVFWLAAGAFLAGIFTLLYG